MKLALGLAVGGLLVVTIPALAVWLFGAAAEGVFNALARGERIVTALKPRVRAVEAAANRHALIASAVVVGGLALAIAVGGAVGIATRSL